MFTESMPLNVNHPRWRGIDDEELLADLLALYFAKCGERLRRLRDAIDVENHTAVRDAAHLLKGSSELVGGSDVAAILARIEDAPDAPAEELRRILDEATEAIDRFRADVRMAFPNVPVDEM